MHVSFKLWDLLLYWDGFFFLSFTFFFIFWEERGMGQGGEDPEVKSS